MLGGYDMLTLLYFAFTLSAVPVSKEPITLMFILLFAIIGIVNIRQIHDVFDLIQLNLRQYIGIVAVTVCITGLYYTSFT